MTFGTWLAVAYAVPRQALPTVCANTTWRPSPATLASTVRPPISAAALPMPRAALGGPPGSVTLAAGPVTGWRRPPARNRRARAGRPARPAPGRPAPGHRAPARPAAVRPAAARAAPRQAGGGRA